MAAANPTTHDAIIKHLYPDPNDIVRAMYENNPLWAMLKKDYSGYGKNWHMPIRIAHTAGRSHTFNNAKTNKAGTVVVELQINVGSNFSLYSVDGKLQRQTSNDKGAFVEAFEFELEGALDAMNRNLGYEPYFNGGGSIGAIQTAGTTLASQLVTLQKPDDIVKFEKGQRLQLATTDGTSGSVKVGAMTVATVDRDAGTFTIVEASISAAIPTASNNSNTTFGDYIFTDGDFGLGVKGLDAWIPATAPAVGGGDSFFGLDRSADPSRLAGSRVDGRGLSPEEQLLKACQVSTRNGGKISHFFMNDIDFLALDLALGSRKMYADAKTEVGIGFTGIKVATGYGFVECFADYNCPQGIAYGIDLKQWAMKGPGQFPFIDSRDGTKILREDAADAYEGRVIGYYQMICKKPAGQVRLRLV